MKSKFFTLGLVLIFLGIVISSFYNAQTESYAYQEGYTKTYQFQTSGYFNEGEELVLGIVPSDEWLNYIDWLQSSTVPEYLDATIQVEINNTNGQRTVVDLIYVTFADTSGNYAQLTLQAADTNFTSGGLSELGPAGAQGGAIKGTVETSGTYTATVNGTPSDPNILYDLNIPPTSVTLDRYTKQMFYPYREMLPIGVALIVSGGISSFWARRQPKMQSLLRKKKTVSKKNS
jgi:hypothetical protein